MPVPSTPSTDDSHSFPKTGLRAGFLSSMALRTDGVTALLLGTVPKNHPNPWANHPKEKRWGIFLEKTGFLGNGGKGEMGANGLKMQDGVENIAKMFF